MIRSARVGSRRLSNPFLLVTDAIAALTHEVGGLLSDKYLRDAGAATALDKVDVASLDDKYDRGGRRGVRAR